MSMNGVLHYIWTAQYIRLHRLDFARINLPIIAIAMSVGCGILTAQVYIVKSSQLPGPSS